jgi:diacylglycerol kinase (ATP)
MRWSVGFDGWKNSHPSARRGLKMHRPRGLEAKSCIILNPRAGSAQQSEILREALTGWVDITIYKTDRAGHATDLAAEALKAGYELIIAAGGDGTIHEVVNGLAADFSRARLGIVPLGTGNDLARTLAIPADPLESLNIAITGPERSLDLLKAEATDGMTYGINVAAGGFSGQVDEVLTDDLKASWGPLAYLIGAVRVVPDLTGYNTTIAWENGPEERIEALNIIVANGRTCAGGFQVAPAANPEDGLLDVVIVRYGDVLALAGVAARLLAGNYLNSDQVMHRRARSVRIASHPGMWFNIDGELFSNQPIAFTVLPQALRVIVGPKYVADPTVASDV